MSTISIYEIEATLASYSPLYIGLGYPVSAHISGSLEITTNFGGPILFPSILTSVNIDYAGLAVFDTIASSPFARDIRVTDNTGQFILNFTIEPDQYSVPNSNFLSFNLQGGTIDRAWLTTTQVYLAGSPGSGVVGTIMCMADCPLAVPMPAMATGPVALLVLASGLLAWWRQRTRTAPHRQCKP